MFFSRPNKKKRGQIRVIWPQKGQSGNPVLEVLLSRDMYLPTRTLNTFFDIDNDPSDDILQQLALIAWLPIEEVTMFFTENRNKAEISYRDNIGRETWRNHPLYKLNMNNLQQHCKKLNIPFKGPKYTIVKLITVANDEEPPQEFRSRYNGDFDLLPENISHLKKLPAATLQHILKYHNLPISGKKDNLVLRVFLLRHGRCYLSSYMQIREIIDFIKLIKSMIFYQMRCEIVGQPDVCRTRKFSGSVLKNTSKIQIPDGVSSQNLEKLLDPLLLYLDTKTERSSEKDINEDPTGFECKLTKGKADDYEDYFEVGSKVKIRWTSTEIGDSGWKPGWYVAEIQASSIDDDEVSVVYVSEPDCVYTVEVMPLLAQGKLRQ